MSNEAARAHISTKNEGGNLATIFRRGRERFRWLRASSPNDRLWLNQVEQRATSQRIINWWTVEPGVMKTNDDVEKLRNSGVCDVMSPLFVIIDKPSHKACSLGHSSQQTKVVEQEVRCSRSTRPLSSCQSFMCIRISDLLPDYLGERKTGRCIQNRQRAFCFRLRDTDTQLLSATS